MARKPHPMIRSISFSAPKTTAIETGQPVKLTYRGYDVEQTADGWIVTLNGERKAKAQSEQSAIDYIAIDIEKRKQSQQAVRQ